MEKLLKTRKKIRISNYDYSNEGKYFITMCVQNRECILSQIKSNQIQLLKYGKITEKYIASINNIYNDLKITHYIIMPNHVHFICELILKYKENTKRVNERIPFIISTLKRFINKECKEKIWQRNYYEHIIRNEKEYLNIIKYINNNPYNWKDDTYYN